MTLKIGKQIIKVYILPNISQSKDNQTIKFGQLIEYNIRNIFFKNRAENKAGRLVPDLFLCFKKFLYEVKASGHYLGFSIFWQFFTWTYNKNKPYECSD